MDYKELLRHQYKRILLIALLIVVGFGFYKVYSAFFQRVDYVWQARFQYDYAQLTTLAKQDLDKAKFDMDFACSGFNVDPQECEQAKANYKEALENYKKVSASKDELFRTEKQVKSYYDAILLSAKQTPLPFLLLVLSFSALVVLSVFLLREILPKRRYKP